MREKTKGTQHEASTGRGDPRKPREHSVPPPAESDPLATHIEPAEDDGGEAVLSGRSREKRDEMHRNSPDESDLGPTSVTTRES